MMNYKEDRIMGAIIELCLSTPIQLVEYENINGRINIHLQKRDKHGFLQNFEVENQYVKDFDIPSFSHAAYQYLIVEKPEVSKKRRLRSIIKDIFRRKGKKNKKSNSLIFKKIINFFKKIPKIINKLFGN
jgi:hypothetical protein